MTEEKSSAPTEVGTPHFTKHARQPASPTGGEELKEGPETRVYEVGYLILPTVAENDVSREVTAIKDILEREQAAVISEEFPRFRPLAYPMRKRKRLAASGAAQAGGYDAYTNGYFGWIKFEVDGARVRRIDESLRQQPEMLRYLITKTVRENTLAVQRPPRVPRTEHKEMQKSVPVSAPVSEAELDKSIEKLIAE